MITLVSTPEYPEPLDPTIICRWLATESPNNFRLLRKDWIPNNSQDCGDGTLQVNFPDDLTGSSVGDDVAVHDATTNAMLIGKITYKAWSPGFLVWVVCIDVPFVVGMNVDYVNDNTVRGGYYFEGRLTVNNVLFPLTIIASPDSFGYADLDVSGILRIVTSLGKVGDYTSRIIKEYTKSGNFSLEYRECWYGSSNTWEGDIVTSPITSPPLCNTWYYGECVRSEEQGSNLHDYVANSLNDAPFLNQFDQPVYFQGLPFDLSFILPEQPLVTPLSDITVTIKFYNSLNTLLHTIVDPIPADSLEGYINSLNIDTVAMPATSAYMTVEISV
jgi:hypothetical protein